MTLTDTPGHRAGFRDRQGDLWIPRADGRLDTPETRPFSREHVEKKWGPLAEVLVPHDCETDPRCCSDCQTHLGCRCGDEGPYGGY